jgi:hypothetical protein
MQEYRVVTIPRRILKWISNDSKLGSAESHFDVLAESSIRRRCG